MPKTAACFSVLLLACGGAPLPGAATAGRSSSTEAEAATDPEAPLIAAAYGYTCVLDGRDLRCVGAVPFHRDYEEEPVRAREVDADLLVATSDGYCVARTGESVVRCFGSMSPSESVYQQWVDACEHDGDCIERAHQKWVRDGMRLEMRGEIRDLAAYDSNVCVLSSVELACWNLAEGDPTWARRRAVPSDAVDLEAESGICCLRSATGAVLCGEDDEDSELGPLIAVENLPPVERIGVEGSFACGLTAQGSAHCWGLYFWIDDGVLLEEHAASRVPMFDGARALSAGSERVCVLDAGGTVRCWGDNRYGSLGPRAPGQRASAPLRVPVQDVVRIAIGLQHVCAIDRRRQVHCWGRGDAEALGERRARRDYRPIEVPGVRADALELHETRSCARTASGRVCWGRDRGEDQLEFWRARPVEVPAGPVVFGRGCALEGASLRCGMRTVSVREVAPASRCVVTEEKAIACVTDGELVDVEGATGVVAIREHSYELVALTEGGELVVFGRSSGAYAVRERRTVGEDGVQLAIHSGLPCLRRRDGSVHCQPSHRETTIRRVELPPVDSLVGGWSHVCALARGEVYCWGRGMDGQLGRESDGAQQPVRVEGVEGAVEIAAGDAHTCARLTDGRVMCWGDDADGQLGARPAWWLDGPVRMTELESGS